MWSIQQHPRRARGRIHNKRVYISNILLQNLSTFSQLSTSTPKPKNMMNINKFAMLFPTNKMCSKFHPEAPFVPRFCGHLPPHGEDESRCRRIAGSFTHGRDLDAPLPGISLRGGNRMVWLKVKIDGCFQK